MAKEASEEEEFAADGMNWRANGEPVEAVAGEQIEPRGEGAESVELAAEEEEEPVAVEEAVTELDEDEDEEEEEDRAYFEGTSVQRDEPFPIEISTVESAESRQPEPELLDPIAPAFDDSSSSELLDLLARESSGGSESHWEASQAQGSGLSDSTTRDPQAAAQDAEAQAAAAETGVEQTADATWTSEESSVSAEADPSTQLPADIQAAAAPGELPAFTEQPAPAAGAPSPSRNAAPKPARGSGLQPVKAWDPTRARKARKGTAGRPGGVDSLNRLAGQLSERELKLRALGPGGEIRRGGKSKLVCFLPVQGGNGSSTVSLHVAEAISHHLNKRVLLADFDFHSGTLAFRLGLKPEHTFVDVFKWEQPEDHLWEKVVCPWKQLDVLVAPPSNSSIHPQSLDRLPDIFMSALRRYPYVVVDHPDAIYSSSRHILAMSDLVYLVCTPEITSLHLARRKVQQIRAMGVPGERLRLIVNRTGSWGSLGLEDVGKIAGVPVSWALMNDYAALRDAVWNGGLVQQGSGLATQLRELGWSVMGVDAQVAAESAPAAEVGSPLG
jgi:MinD-like ATPase involved in chromosome partitioning or flagellar assembly